MFKDFLPFYEFVIGPIHSGAFGPGSLDGSFGPEYEYGKYERRIKRRPVPLFRGI
jgi:alkaline phosphatase D